MRTIRRASTAALLEARHALDAKKAEEAVHLALDALRDAWELAHGDLTGRSSKKGTESHE
jgi:hypothetical protein